MYCTLLDLLIIPREKARSSRDTRAIESDSYTSFQGPSTSSKVRNGSLISRKDVEVSQLLELLDTFGAGFDDLLVIE